MGICRVSCAFVHDDTMRLRTTNFLATLLCATHSLIPCFGGDEVSRAQQSAGRPQQIYAGDALLRGCCDDYCRKLPPCVPDFCSACSPDDYCRKPCPYIPCYSVDTAAGCYCRKPWPDLCRPLFGDYYTCAGERAACAEVGAYTSHAQPPGPLFNPAASQFNAAGRR
jgi:hypothetical protein